MPLEEIKFEGREVELENELDLPTEGKEISPEEFLGECGKFVSCKLGAPPVEFVIQGVKKIKDKDPKYNLSKRDYKYIVKTDSGELSVGSWGLYNALQPHFKIGAKVRLSHPGTGKYECTPL